MTAVSSGDDIAFQYARHSAR